MCFLYGHGVDEDNAIAVQWFEKAAEQGDAKGEVSIGQSCLRCQGVEKDENASVEWFTKAAEQWNAQALFSLG